MQNHNRTHEDLAKAWAIFNGQKGTQKQVEKTMKQLPIESLKRMCEQRGI